MKTNCDTLNLGQAPHWLSAWSALALLLGTHLSQAVEVILSDGLTHTISNASFQNDTITVENGTKLIINPGAVFGGAVTDSGKILAKDTSTVTINGGTFGGAGERSGHVYSGGTSTMTILGGNFGGTGIRAGRVTAMDTATVTIQAEVFNTTSYSPSSGGPLGVTFPLQSPKSVPVKIRGGRVLLNVVTYPAASWLLTHGLWYDSELSQDPDGDGVNLLTAYALNLDPRLNLRGRLPGPVLGADTLSLNFHASSPGITYTVETSTNLTHWTTTGVTQSAPGTDGRSTASVPRNAPQRFLRLVVQD